MNAVAGQLAIFSQRNTTYKLGDSFEYAERQAVDIERDGWSLGPARLGPTGTLEEKCARRHTVTSGCMFYRVLFLLIVVVQLPTGDKIITFVQSDEMLRLRTTFSEESLCHYCRCSKGVSRRVSIRRMTRR